MDTNVLLYATLSNDPRHAARAVIEARNLPGNHMFATSAAFRW